MPQLLKYPYGTAILEYESRTYDGNPSMVQRQRIKLPSPTLDKKRNGNLLDATPLLRISTEKYRKTILYKRHFYRNINKNI